MLKFLTFTFVFLFFNIGFGCSCIGKGKLKTAIKKSDVILTGKILNKNIFIVKFDESGDYEGLNISYTEYSVLITKKLKGQIISDTIRVVTGVGKGDCGYNFLVGSNYIIYGVYAEKYIENGEKVDRFLSTGICSKTKLYNLKEEKKVNRIVRRLRL
ncbi:MAG: hypothetical protein V4548_07295 [Bacteroidota bacterium]